MTAKNSNGRVVVNNKMVHTTSVRSPVLPVECEYGNCTTVSIGMDGWLDGRFDG